VTVPDEVDRDFAREKRAIVVMKKLSRVLHQLIQPPCSQGDVEDRYEKEDFQKKA